MFSPYGVPKGLLTPDEESQLQKNTLLQLGLGLLSQSGPSLTPTSLGQSFGKAGMQAMAGQTDAIQGLLQNKAYQQKLADAQLAKQREAKLAELVGSKATDPSSGASPSPSTGLVGALGRGDPNALQDFYANMAGLGGDYTKEALTSMNVLQQQKNQANGRGEYFVPVQTANGVVSFDSRKGTFTDPTTGKAVTGPVLGSNSDPTLQGRISGAKEGAKVTAGAQAGANNNLADAESFLPQVQDTVKKLSDLGKKATYSMAGKVRDAIVRQTGGGATESAVAREEYINTVRDVLLPQLKQTFGAQFTEAEGKRLESTLGDPDKSPEEKDAALRAFVDQKKRTIDSMRRRVGSDVRRYNPATGRIE